MLYTLVPVHEDGTAGITGRHDKVCTVGVGVGGCVCGCVLSVDVGVWVGVGVWMRSVCVYICLC